MAEHGLNHVDEAPTRSRGRFLEVLGFGLLAVAGGVGGGLLGNRLWPDAPAQPAAPTAKPMAPDRPARPAPPSDDDDDDNGQDPDR
jgi:hypothetical protein